MYGVYGPVFELQEHTAREPGSEEYLDSEKYQIRHWDIDRPDSLRYFIARLNEIRRAHPALQRNDTLRFHGVDNDQLVCWTKTTATDRMLFVVNLDPRQVQSGMTSLDLPCLGVAVGRGVRRTRPVDRCVVQLERAAQLRATRSGLGTGPCLHARTHECRRVMTEDAIDESDRLRRSSPLLLSDPTWYRDAVIYQLHVRAFADSDGDGIGDFRGLTRKLDYLQDLGITAIWLLPFYPSPLRDEGYDISDYRGINPSYGNLRQFRRFLDEAHRRELRVITEVVLNHTSDQHPWFQRARSARPG